MDGNLGIMSVILMDFYVVVQAWRVMWSCGRKCCMDDHWCRKRQVRAVKGAETVEARTQKTERCKAPEMDCARDGVSVVPSGTKEQPR